MAPAHRATPFTTATLAVVTACALSHVPAVATHEAPGLARFDSSESGGNTLEGPIAGGGGGEIAEAQWRAGH